MFNDKGPKFSYPEQPYSAKQNEEHLTEDEIEIQRQQFITALMTMQTNFNLNKEKEKQMGEWVEIYLLP